MRKIFLKIKKNACPQCLKHSFGRRGYTIIETMIAISLFLVVTLVGLEALLSANIVHNKSKDMREVMDSLSFIAEDMSRNLRTGYNFHCIDDDNYKTEYLSTPRSCIGGARAVAFEHQDGDINNWDDQWVYSIGMPDSSELSSIFKSTDGGATWTQLNPPELGVNLLYGFSVFGAEPPDASGGGDNQQPFVNIRLNGDITFKNIVTPFSLQTSVSQRVIDI